MSDELKQNDARIDLRDVVKIEYLTPEKASFTENDGYISFRIKVEKGDENTDSKDKDESVKTDVKIVSTDTGETVKEYKRVFLHRAFPFDLPDEYISVLDKDQSEIGIIRRLSDFPVETVELLNRELKRKYFIFTIVQIISVNKRFGFSYWKVRDLNGERSFTLQDTYKSISKINQDRILIIDVDGNRYEIPSLAALDRKSYKKIELYL